MLQVAQAQQAQLMPAFHQLAPMPYGPPLPPPPVNGKVSPQMAALYQQALNAHQQLTQLSVQPQHSPLNLGVPYGRNPLGALLNQGNQFNPGFSPLQATHSFVPSQQLNVNPLSAWQVNPQNSPTQQNWLP